MVESPSSKDGERNPYEPPVDIRPPVVISQQISVPLAVGLAAMIGVAFLFNWGIGISLMLVAVPAYIRAAGLSFQKLSAGEEPSTSERILAFISSVMVVTVCAVAGGIGFFTTCLGVLAFGTVSEAWLLKLVNDEAILVIAIAICGLGFLVAAGVVFWLFWPGRKRK